MSRTGTGQPEYRLHFGYPTIRVERDGAAERRIPLDSGDPFPALEAVAEEVARARGRVIAILPEREVWRGRAQSAAAARPIAAGALGAASDRVVLRLGRRGADGRRPVAAVSKATLADARAFLARGGLGAARLTAPGAHGGFEGPPDFGRFALADLRVGAPGAAAGLAAALALAAWLTPWSQEPAAVVVAPAAPANLAALPPAPVGFPDPTAPVRVAAAPAAPAPEAAPAPVAPRVALAAAPAARPATLAALPKHAPAAVPVAKAASAPAAVKVAAIAPEARPAAPVRIEPALNPPTLSSRNLPANFAPVAPPRSRPLSAEIAAAPAEAAAPRAEGAPMPRPRAAMAAAPAAAPATAPAAVAADRVASPVSGGPRPRPTGSAALTSAALNARIGAALAVAAADLGPRARPADGAPNAQSGAVRVASLVPTASVLNDFSAAAPAFPAATPTPRPAAAPVASAPAKPAAPQRLAALPPARAEAPRSPAPAAPLAAARPAPSQPVVRAAAPQKPVVRTAAASPTLRAAPQTPAAPTVRAIPPTPVRAVSSAAPKRVAPATVPMRPIGGSGALEPIRFEPAAKAPTTTAARPAAKTVARAEVKPQTKTARFQQPAAPTTRAAVKTAAVKPAAVKPQRQAEAVERRTTRKPAAAEMRGGASKLALVGVFGGAGGRHALIQLPNGSTERVKAGDSFGGVQVTAISANAVQLRSRGRDTVLTLPE